MVDFFQQLFALAEKMGLLAAAALVAVLFPPLRSRVLGVGRRRDKVAGLLLGLGLAIWGTTLGFYVGKEHINVRAIGVIIAGILGGRKAGALAGLAGGLFYAARAERGTEPWVLLASVVDGVLAGQLAVRVPRAFSGWRTFFTSTAIQGVHLVVVGAGLFAMGSAARYLPAWPAHLVKIVVNSAGITLFMVVTRIVVSREENRVALVEAQAAANAASLQALQRTLEPHFLFNTLNTLRATIRTNPDHARELVADLADLYRYVLSHPDDSTLRDEVAHACAYLAIEQARLGAGRLTIKTDMAPSLEGIRIPALTLQPLVENAIVHGVSRSHGSGTVTIRAHARHEEGCRWLIVEVCDDVEPVAHAEGFADAGRDSGLHSEGHGLALRTLRERLRQRYSAHATLELHPHERGCVARIEIPLDLDEASSRHLDSSRGVSPPATLPNEWVGG